MRSCLSRMQFCSYRWEIYIVPEHTRYSHSHQTYVSEPDTHASCASQDAWHVSEACTFMCYWQRRNWQEEKAATKSDSMTASKTWTEPIITITLPFKLKILSKTEGLFQCWTRVACYAACNFILLNCDSWYSTKITVVIHEAALGLQQPVSALHQLHDPTMTHRTRMQ